MLVEWNSLPLLPLRCILDYLSLENALAATSTCRHWRQAMLLYEGNRDTLTLRVKNLEKNVFLTRLFKKHTRKLHVHINCSIDELDKFLTFLLPQYFDSKKLEELVFVGPAYLQENPVVPFLKLNRVITESLVFKNARFMEMLAFIGCEMNTVTDDIDRFVHKQVEYYSKPLLFSCVTSPADSVLSRRNIDLMMYSSLKHIIFEYDTISTEALETLSQLTNLNLVSLNVTFKRQKSLPAVDWRRVNARFSKGLDVAVNIIDVHPKRFEALSEIVFVEGMSLVSLKVMFCKTLYKPLLTRVCCYYSGTLQELVWVDCPYEGSEAVRTIRAPLDQMFYEGMYSEVNPFILLCWRCENLRILVVHGYWVWQYDMLGFVRLRNSLQIEISSLYDKHDKFDGGDPVNCSWRVMHTDLPVPVTNTYVEMVNEYSDHQWRPQSWRRLHPALRVDSTPEYRSEFTINEVLKPLGVT